MKTIIYVLRNIKKYTSLVKGCIFGLIIVNILSVPISLVPPKFFQLLVDEVMWKRKYECFIVVVTGLLSVYILRFICDALSLFLSNRVLNIFTYSIRKDVINKYIKVPYSFFEKKEIGELKMRIMDDVDSLGNFIKEHVVDYISQILIVITTLYMSFHISVTMTLCCLLIVPFVFLINYFIGFGTKRVNEEIRTINSQYYTSTHNSLQFWREIKAQNSEKTFINRFKWYRTILAKLGFKFIRYWAFSEVFNDFKSNYLSKVFVYIVGTFFVMRKDISVGVLIMFSEYFAMLFLALDSLNSKIVALKTNAPYYKRIFDTFSFPEENVHKSFVPNLENGITIKNLSFSYAEEQPVLKNINLQINKGDYIAIVGKTGCGKTTLVKLLMGLYETNKGQILYDGVNISQINKNSLYNIMGIVMQDSVLFNMSLRENLLLANENATDEDMKEACKKANIYDFIMSLPHGFNTKIGERGVKLSGGQKQRILIATALLKKPKIIIFDEATSSLDKPSEQAINDAINEIAKDATVIVITHNPSTALRAQKIAVMENGEINAVGTHDYLLNKNEYYTKFINGVNKA